MSLGFGVLAFFLGGFVWGFGRGSTCMILLGLLAWGLGVLGVLEFASRGCGEA